MAEQGPTLVSHAARLNVLVERLQELESALRSGVPPHDLITELSWLVTFRIGDGRYALPLLQTREVVRFAKLTSVPGAPPYLLGMLNLRGEPRPVVDPLVLWGQAPLVVGLHSAIVVIEACSRVYGILVDQVEDVVSSGKLEAGPTTSAASDDTSLSACVRSTVRDGAHLFHLLDPARLLAPALIAELDEALTRALDRAARNRSVAEAGE